MKRLFKSKLILTLVTVVMLTSAVLVALAGPLVHLHATSNSHQSQITLPPSNIQAESQWFWLSHFGNQQVPVSNIDNAQVQATQVFERSGDNAWVPLGPQPLNTQGPQGLVSGRITAEAVNPTNSNDLWVGGAAGGVWNSLNGGHLWNPKTDQQRTLAVGSLAVDPNQPNTIYVGTGEANFNADAYWGIGVLKSTNHGATWTRLGGNIFGGLGVGRIAVDPANSQILLLSAILDNFPGPKGKNNSGNVGIWRSTNGGITWMQVLSGSPASPGTDVVFDPANPGIAFAGLGGNTTASGIYKSTDSGQTWTLLSSGVPTGSSIQRVSLGISSSGSNVYAVLGDSAGDLLGSAIYVSTNTGATWTAKNVSGVPGMVDDDTLHQWFYDNYAAVDPTDSTGNTAYVGGVDIWQTTDGGTTWKNLTHATTGGPVHSDQHALTFRSRTSSSYYLGNDGGVWSGTKTGTFTDLNAGGLNITQFYSGSIGEVGPHAQLYAGAQDNGEDQYPGTPSRVAQWKEVLVGDGGYTAVDYTNNAIVYQDRINLNINKSTDGGATWSIATTGINPADPVNFIAPLVISPSNHNELFAGTNRVYRTTNGATSWAPISPALDGSVEINAIAVAPSNDSVIYVGYNDGKVFVTTNGGTSWTGGPVPGSTGGFVRGLAVDPGNPSIVYVSFADFATSAGHHVFKSTNGGTTWTDISTSLPNIPFSSILIFSEDGEQDILVGSDVGIFGTENGGSSWARIGHGLPNVPIDQVFMNLSGTKIFVATHGRGMWVLVNPDVD